MTSWRQLPAQTPPGLGWARRAVLQQLDALSRLAAVARRLIDPPRTPTVETTSARLMAGVRGLEKALHLHARAAWAMRLIDALCARLVDELHDLESGRAPAPVEAPGLAADFEPSASSALLDTVEQVERAEAPERPERPERLERLERERFGFERRMADKEFEEILKRPAAEIIALICRELGLPDDWPRLAEEAWVSEKSGDDGPEPPGRPALRPSPDPARISAAPS